MVTVRRQGRGRGDGSTRRQRRGSLLLAASVGLSLVGGTVVAAGTAQAKTTKPTVVVKVVARGSFGDILTTVKKKALYIDTTPPCTGSCLTIWPPLLMPKGKTTPAGVTGLGTTPFGTGQLQVTYNGMPLYLFYTDTKKTVSGQGVGGFEVVQVP